MSDTMYFCKDTWIHSTNQALESWRKRWRLPSRIKSVLQDWVQEQWRRHEQSCQDHRKRHWAPFEVKRALGSFQHLVRGPADHFPNSLFVSCPVHYHELLLRTLGDEQVFNLAVMGLCQPCDIYARTLSNITPTSGCISGPFSGNMVYPLLLSCPKNPSFS